MMNEAGQPACVLDFKGFRALLRNDSLLSSGVVSVNGDNWVEFVNRVTRDMNLRLPSQYQSNRSSLELTYE